MTKTLQLFLLITTLFCFASLAHAADSKAPSNKESSSYKINPGDILAVQVWNEESLSLPQVLVRPDGKISLPILGEQQAGGFSVSELQLAIGQALLSYLKDEPTVTVSTLQLNGNTIYVLGKVNRPGAFVMNARLDVAQALALAGGLNTFADADSIKILRRNEQGLQSSIKFKYNKLEKGDELDSNILLKSGDVVLVP